ncbi:MAG: M48 family metalloprotease, partial [Bacteriovoracaceae bacterium]
MKMLILTLLFFGCAHKTSDRYREGDNTGQQAALTVEEERQLSLEALKEMQKDYPPTKDKELQAYIERIGHKLVKANGLENNPYKYTFTVVDMNQINAFALPAGTIFITIPIIAMADSEAEIAGVLG